MTLLIDIGKLNKKNREKKNRETDQSLSLKRKVYHDDMEGNTKGE